MGLHLEGPDAAPPPEWLYAAVKSNGAEIIALLKAGESQAPPPPPPGGDQKAPPPPPGDKNKSKLAEDKLIATHFADGARNHAVHLSMTGGYARRIRPWGGKMASLFKDG
jgi:hypothetical protein